MQSGTRYDFIEKKVVPTYEYNTTERIADTAGEVRERGSVYGLDPGPRARLHRIRAATDPDGHTAGWIEWADQPPGGAAVRARADPDLTSDAR